MRLWSLHPSLLDPQGLVALWREALLAQKVLRGKTKGYRFHPQLLRFRRHRCPDQAIATYLWCIHEEAARRGYEFDAAKILGARRRLSVRVTHGQLEFELIHLKDKLRSRAPERYRALCQLAAPITHPMFKIVEGPIEDWERPVLAKRIRRR